MYFEPHFNWPNVHSGNEKHRNRHIDAIVFIVWNEQAKMSARDMFGRIEIYTRDS